MKLITGNKAYSSWSLRPWIAMKTFGIAFEEEVVPLFQPDTQRRILNHAAGGTVPILIDGDVVVWESLAILSHLAEAFPDQEFWPKDRAARAFARSASHEMHAGFLPLRMRCPMNFLRAPARVALADDVKANVARIEAIWRDGRRRFGAAGPFLCGRFSIVDAMFAPVVNRFHVYDVAVSADARAYMAAIMALPAWAEWSAGAAAEPWRHAAYDDVA